MKVSSSGPPTSVMLPALAESWLFLVELPVSVDPAVQVDSQLLGAPLTGNAGGAVGYVVMCHTRQETRLVAVSRPLSIESECRATARRRTAGTGKPGRGRRHDSCASGPPRAPGQTSRAVSRSKYNLRVLG